jgi:Bacterial Ig domain
MSKKTRQRRPPRASGHSSSRQRQVVATVGVILLLALVGGILANWRAATDATTTAAALTPSPASSPSLAPNSPAKEYIYAGGKLVAIEEPSPSSLAPVVQLTAPANGTSLPAPATISLTATASDTDGTVTKVEFFQGATKLGEDTTSPYDFNWSNVAVGSYSLTAKATDNSGLSTTSAVVNMTVNNNGATQENVIWTNLIKVAASGNSLTRTATTHAWDGGASSTKAIQSGDGYVEFTVGEGGTYRMCGLSNGDTDQNYNDIDFALYPSANGMLSVYEGGVWRGELTAYTVGDVFRVAIEGGVVKYRKNGTLLYSSTVAPTYPLRVDTSLYTPNSTINNAVISGNLIQVATGAEAATWTNLVNVTASGNSLTRTATTHVWDGGASSTKAIASGDGYVEFTVGESGTYRMCGLSNGDTNQNYNDIDFALYPSANGMLNVYEGGVWRGELTTYTAGDTFRVEVEGGVVKYKKNGTVIYTSQVTPTYPLRVDTSLYTPNSTINNVVICGLLTP